MNDENKQPDECLVEQTDALGDTNLCCCYIIDPDGGYEDICHLPVDSCCVGD